MFKELKSKRKQAAQRAVANVNKRFRNKKPSAVFACSYSPANSPARSPAATKLKGKLTRHAQEIYSRHEASIKAKAAWGKLKRPDPPKRILKDASDAHRVLTFFFGKGNVRLGVANLGEQDIEFAQALLVEGIDASYKMGYVESLFRAVAGKGKIKDIIKDFGKKALKHWFNHATEDDLRNAKIYKKVRNEARRNFNSAWLQYVEERHNDNNASVWSYVG